MVLARNTMSILDTPEPLARRLSDKIQQAFDQACEQSQLEVAACLLKALDLVLLSRPESWDRRQKGLHLIRTLHARLARLREAEPATDSAPPGAVPPVVSVPDHAAP